MYSSLFVSGVVLTECLVPLNLVFNSLGNVSVVALIGCSMYIDVVCSRILRLALPVAIGHVGRVEALHWLLGHLYLWLKLKVESCGALIPVLLHLYVLDIPP